MSNKHKLIMKRPASWFGQIWKEALPLGNGEMGALVHGGVKDETVVITRHDLWHWGADNPLPDVRETLKMSREAMDLGEFAYANSLLSDTLKAKGYTSSLAVPFPLAALKISIGEEACFYHYQRVLDMENGEAIITYEQGENQFQRRCMVSRRDQVLAYEICSKQLVKDMKVSLALHDTNDTDYRKMQAEVKESLAIHSEDNFIFFKAKNDDDTEYGAVVRVVSSGNYPERLETEEEGIKVLETNHLLVLVKSFARGDSKTAFPRLKNELNQLPIDYDRLLSTHSLDHQQLYLTSDISLTSEDGEYDLSNEALLMEAYQEEASPVLIEKLWHFGRYLMISGACETSNPFPLYGLWNAEYNPVWSQNVANENVEIIYWHLQTGGLIDLVKPLIQYYFDKIPMMQENAQKLFGCKGIYLSTYSTPVNTFVNPVVPVITNWIGGAGWIAQHFYSYYQFTKDDALLKDKILPFMVEAAQFYADYAVYETDGSMKIYPSVSPENNPKNFIPRNHSWHDGHAISVAYNATMDFAIIKELLTNLISVCEETKCYLDQISKWKQMISTIPAYQINEDGAIKEWMHPDLKDHYRHRHLSHIYPVFPGTEISKGKDDELMKAFEKAVDLRELGGQCGWSLVHMAAIYARFSRGEDSIHCLDLLLKGVTLNNFCMISNDYRSMGVTMDIGQFAPIQLDANMGLVNALQEMLLYVGKDSIQLMPACPKRLLRGEVKDFHYHGGTISFSWDRQKGYFSAVIKAESNVSLAVLLPEFCSDYEFKTNPYARMIKNERTLQLKMDAHGEIRIEGRSH